MRALVARVVVTLACLLLAPGCSDSIEVASDGPKAVPPTASSAPEPFIALGDVPVDTSVTFEIMPGALGFNLTATGPDDARIDVKTLTGPNGVVVVNQSTVVDSNRKVPRERGVTSVQVPSNDVPFTHGTWTAVFEGPEGTTLHASVRVQYTKDGEFHGGLLDAHVWIPDGLVVHDPSDAHAINANAAPDDDAIQARLDKYFTTLEELFGLERGEVTYHALPAAYLVIETPEQFAALNRATADVPTGPGIHLMFVQRLSFANSGGDPFTWALSSGIPGAAWLSGTARSGIAISNDALTNADGDGISLAHETGHFFGLFHTTEFSGDLFDPLADTAECKKMGTTRDVFSRCPDAKNLMFPAPYAASNGGIGLSLSESQRRIVHGSPVYRAR